MRHVRRLLGDDAERGPLSIRPHRLGELGWLIHRQGLLYNQQFGWNGEFEALIARIYGELRGRRRTPPKELWVAEQDGARCRLDLRHPVGRPARHGAAAHALCRAGSARAGHRHARWSTRPSASRASAGYERIRLWTQAILVSARRIYAAAGFSCVETGQHH